MPLNPSAYVTGGEEGAGAVSEVDSVGSGDQPGCCSHWSPAWRVGMGVEKITLMPMGRGLTHASPPF